MMTEPCQIIGGIDTHADTIHVAAIDDRGQPQEDHEYPTTPSGYRRAIAFLASLGPIRAVGVEGTSSYGAGITRALAAQGITVAEVIRPDRADRRRHGNSDPLDAYAAARIMLAGRDLATPKTPETDALRALVSARRSAVKARTAAINQIKALLVTAPDTVREKYRHLRNRELIRSLARCRPAAATDPTALAVLTATQALAQRVEFLHGQDAQLAARIDEITAAADPALRAAHGVGPDTAAQLLITAGANPHRLHSEAAFAALCGAAPVPASSGKTTRHRLSRGGDRAANNALHRIALVRMSNHQHTREYVVRQTAKGRTKKEILRLLKRAIAREMFKLLTRPVQVPEYDDLRPTRQNKNITLTAVAQNFGVWPTVISRIERGLQRDDTFVDTYREWLTAA